MFGNETEELDESIWEKMIQEVDENGDGII